MGNLWRLLRYIKPYRWQAIGSLALLLGVVAADLAVPRLTQEVIDRGVASQDMQRIVSTSLLMLGAAVLSALFSVANTILSVRVALNVSADLRSGLVRKVQTFSFGNLDRAQTGQLLVRTTNDVSQVEMVVQLSLRILTRAPLWMLGSAVMLAATSFRLVLLMLVLLPAVAVIIAVFLTKGRPMFASVQKRLDRLSQVLQENLSGVRVVKAFVRADHERGRFEEANLGLTRQTIGVMQLVAVMIPTMMLFVNLAIVGVVWFGGRFLISGIFTAGEIVASVNYMSFTLFPLMMLGGMIGPVSAADASAGRILEVLDSEPEVQDSGSLFPSRPWKGRIAFEGVCFDYNHGCSEPVLVDIDIVAEPGQTVALLGATGSGKSTLVNLIPRFYDVDRGRIALDGVDVRDIPLAELRGQIGVALQESVLFSGSIRDNICYGRPDATEEEIVSVARAAQVDSFIRALPAGYDTSVSQRGMNLSGGQKQRIAIARALLTRPKVLILDDSTSAVDLETEARIRDALHELMGTCTSFVIAQRISTVLDADQIVVLDGGRIAAQGTHDELLASSSLYREIYESQLGSERPVANDMRQHED